MEPRIQYAKTADGVSIAFCVAGEGSPLLFVSHPPFCHVQLDWQSTFGYIMRPLAVKHRFVWFDWPATGLSDRDAVDFSMDAMIRAMEGVVSAAGLEKFAISATVMGTLIAVTYAAARPERVSHLVLADGWTKFAEIEDSPLWQAERALRDKDWVIYSETFMRVLWGIQDEAFARKVAEYLRACVEPRAHRAAFSAMESYDISAALPKLAVPTLVVHNQSCPWASVQAGQRLAAHIADARFLVVDDPIYAQLPALIDEFLAEGEPQVPQAEPPPAPTAFRTVLFTDLVGHTQMMSRLGDERGRAVLREHERITREVLKAYGGTEVKTMGDGFMASFGSVTKAVECAMALQEAFHDRNRGVGASHDSPEGAASRAPTSPPARPEVSKERAGHEPLHVRVGLNAGEPIEEEGDLFGATVILAARIAAKADGGEILVANAVRELCAGKGFPFADRGDFVAKGFEEPVRVYEVRWRE